MVGLHINNDFTGSTRVFASVIDNVNFNKVWINGKKGFVKGRINVHYLNFNFGKWNFLFVNAVVFFRAILGKREDIYYCSTILSFGLGLAGWLRGSRVVMHKHEVGLGSSILYKILSVLWRIISPDVIAVSEYCLNNGLKFQSSRSKILYNPNPYNGSVHADIFKVKFRSEFCVIMPTSCKAYKGVNLFIELAKSMQDVKFILALSSIDEHQINRDYAVLTNLSVLVRPNNLDELYSNSHAVLNLSDPEKWIETFGLTLIEGMFFGCIPIASNIGGPTEIIRNEVNGILIDDYSISSFRECIESLRDNYARSCRLSLKARKDSEQYSLSAFRNSLNEFLEV